MFVKTGEDKIFVSCDQEAHGLTRRVSIESLPGSLNAAQDGLCSFMFPRLNVAPNTVILSFRDLGIITETAHVRSKQ
jgi:hypothetical protein